MCGRITLQIPNTEIYLVPGCLVKLGRFDNDRWYVKYGWYTWGGNRPVCGWYLEDKCNKDTIKPLQLTDLDDIYILENSKF